MTNREKKLKAITLSCDVSDKRLSKSSLECAVLLQAILIFIKYFTHFQQYPEILKFHIPSNAKGMKG